MNLNESIPVVLRFSFSFFVEVKRDFVSIAQLIYLHHGRFLKRLAFIRRILEFTNPRLIDRVFLANHF